MSDSTSHTPRRNLKFLPTRATFKLLEPIGTGTVGTVYRAESPDISGPVAIKLLHPTFTDDENIAGRFQREIVIMERLNHPHIVRNYGGGVMDGQYFYAMQLLDRGNLKDHIKTHGPLTWQQTAAYAAQIRELERHVGPPGVPDHDGTPEGRRADHGGRVRRRVLEPVAGRRLARTTVSALVVRHGLEAEPHDARRHEVPDVGAGGQAVDQQDAVARPAPSPHVQPDTVRAALHRSRDVAPGRHGASLPAAASIRGPGRSLDLEMTRS